jgi:hypothetical protein
VDGPAVCFEGRFDRVEAGGFDASFFFMPDEGITLPRVSISCFPRFFPFTFGTWSFAEEARALSSSGS